MRVDRLDHLVLTVTDIAASIAFYSGILGMRATTFGDGRHALAFGGQKINLHLAGHEFEPKAAHPLPGSADVCLIVTGSLEEVAAELQNAAIEIEEGPVGRTGATGPMESVYVRDPDGNLVELSAYV